MDLFLSQVDAIFKGIRPTFLIFYTLSVIFILYILLKILNSPKGLTGLIFAAVKSVPGVKGQIDSQVNKIISEVSKTIPKIEMQDTFILPSKGIPRQEVVSIITKLKEEEDKINSKINAFSGTVYIRNKEHLDMMGHAYRLFINANPLHTFTFPVIRKMEAEVVSMTKNMLHGGEDCCGIVTSGGTESILMAMKSYRDYALKHRGITEPELIFPTTAHCSFEKACHYFKIKQVHVNVNPKTFKADLAEIKKMINKNTIAIVGSAPNFSVGIIDPIEEMAALAQQYGIGLHVDCCLGGFFLPFVRDGSLPKFDFSVKGVTSISADTHKYGCASKGTSCIMYSSKELKAAMYFISPSWTGGIYATPSISGSRPGALVATCWSSMMAMGESGYLEATEGMIKAQRIIKNGVKKIKELELMGDPLAMVIAWRWVADNPKRVFAVNDAMKALGWDLNVILNPAGSHVCLTHHHIGMGEQFVKDLQKAVENVKETPEKFKESMGVYGTVIDIPSTEPIEDFLTGFLHTIDRVKV